MEVGLAFILIICVACLFDDEHGYENWWKNWKGAWAKYRAERAEAKRTKLENK